MILKKVTSVAVGAINPAIIVPAWIMKEEILPKGDAKSEHTLSPAGLSVRHTLQNLQWVVTNSNIIVEVVEVSEHEKDAADFLSAVLSKLQHTPIRAIGNNFTFEIPTENSVLDDFAFTGQTLSNALPGIEKQINKLSGVFEFLDDRNVQVQVTIAADPADNKRDVSFNFHREVSKFEEAKVALGFVVEDLDKAKAIVKQFWSE